MPESIGENGSDSPLSAEEKRQALALVLQSETFSRADQLQRFLRYVCEMEEAGRAAEISEYSIGMDALKRPAAYSPGEDSGVRGRAHALRQKLQQFYQTERPDATLRVGLRKGSYIPYYYVVAPPAPVVLHAVKEPEAPIAPPADPSVPRPYRGNRHIAWGVAAALLSVLTFAGIERIPAFLNARQDSVLEDFWRPMLDPESDVLLCLATPPSLLIKPFRSHVPTTVFPLPDGVNTWYKSLKLPEVGGVPYMYRSVDAPLFGDSAAALKAAQVITAHGGSYQFLPENIVGPAALRNRNVILIGGPNYSAYAARILRNTPLTIQEDDATGEEIIRDRSRAAGAPLPFMYKRDAAGKLLVVYGLITTFSNQAGVEKGQRAIIISGITGSGTSAAMDFLASPAGLTALRERFRKDGITNIPATYQVVVKASRDRAMPLSWELAGYRVMDRPPTFD